MLFQYCQSKNYLLPGYILLFFVLTTIKIYSQNLVPNHSFERVHKFDQNWSGSYKDYNSKLKEWNSPTQASPDLLFDRYKDQMIPYRPNLDLSKIKPRDGRLMTGIKVFGCAYKALHCKEYLQIKLIKPLKKDSTYIFSLWYNYPAGSVSISSLDIGLSDTLITDNLNQNLLLPDETYSIDLELESPERWHRAHLTFIPSTNYEYLIIGSMKSDDELRSIAPHNLLKYGYYLLDKVELIAKNLKTADINIHSNRLILEDVSFKFDSAVLNKSGINVIHKYLCSFNYNQIAKVTIVGWSDKTGNGEYNLKLSQARADFVKKILIEKGIDKNLIFSLGKGEIKDQRLVEMIIELKD